MTRHFIPVILVGALAVPIVASAQHTNSGGAPAIGTAAPSGGGSSGGSSSSGSAGDGNA